MRMVPLAPVGAAGQTLVEHVHAVPSRHIGGRCLFRIDAPLVGGGAQVTCISALEGLPGPRATLHSRGVMTFVLAGGSIRAAVRITQRFAADGVHARQSVIGTISGGGGRFRGARGTIGGGGSVVDRRAGLGPVDLRYTLRLG